MNVVGQKVLPHDPVIDAGAANPSFEDAVRDDFRFQFARGQVNA